MAQVRETATGVYVASFAGEVTFANSNAEKESVKSNLPQNLRLLVVDLSQVPFMDSSGVGVLVSLLKFCRERQAALRVAGVSPRLQQVLEITQLTSILEIFPEVAAALGPQGSPPAEPPDPDRARREGAVVEGGI